MLDARICVEPEPRCRLASSSGQPKTSIRANELIQNYLRDSAHPSAQRDFPDPLATDLVSRVCSSRMKNIVNLHAASTDILQWLPIRVDKGRETRDYHVLHFPEPPDVLDKAATLYVDDTDHVIKRESR